MEQPNAETYTPVVDYRDIEKTYDLELLRMLKQKQKSMEADFKRRMGYWEEKLLNSHSELEAYLAIEELCVSINQDQEYRKILGAIRAITLYLGKAVVKHNVDLNLDSAREANCTRILEEVGYEVRRGKTKCFDHADQDPSMSVNKDYVFCHACGARYDSIGLFMRLHSTDFITSVKQLQNLL